MAPRILNLGSFTPRTGRTLVCIYMKLNAHTRPAKMALRRGQAFLCFDCKVNIAVFV